MAQALLHADGLIRCVIWLIRVHWCSFVVRANIPAKGPIQMTEIPKDALVFRGEHPLLYTLRLDD